MTLFSSDADHFSECVEKHAYSTYDKFIKLHGGMRQYLFSLQRFIAKIVKFFVDFIFLRISE